MAKANVVTIPFDDLVSACSSSSNDASINAINALDRLIETAFGSASTRSSSTSSTSSIGSSEPHNQDSNNPRPTPTDDQCDQSHQPHQHDQFHRGLGILAITNIPNLPSLRSKLLPLAKTLASLPQPDLEAMEVPEAEYQVGWSHGREKVEGDKFDFGKGSFYANPLVDDLVGCLLERRRCFGGFDEDDGVDGNGECLREVLQWDESLRSIPMGDGEEFKLRTLAKSSPGFFAPNVWPTESLPELEPTLKEMGKLVHQVGRMVARCCDSYVAKRCPGYEPHKLENVLRHSKMCKARLLHYFATSDENTDGSRCSSDTRDTSNQNDSSVTNDANDANFSNWCGWHNDHGSLTALLPAMYLDPDGTIVPCPDDEAGLYIKSRTGELVHVSLPEDSLAFQVGETMQIHSGGWLQATPHAVRGCKGGNVTRETFAVFMEPEYHTSMNLPEGRTVEDTQCMEAQKHLPSTVRTLQSRWKLGMNFGEFSNATFAAFH